jgi:hypothetical protein
MQEKGAISGRLFEPSKAGGKILKLSGFGVLFHPSIED